MIVYCKLWFIDDAVSRGGLLDLWWLITDVKIIRDGAAILGEWRCEKSMKMLWRMDMMR